ncbi:MAG: hypothetical protein ACFFED_14305 [Candidatus Thorarchaeota archaeon]
MDFALSVIISGLISSGLLVSSVLVFFNRLQAISNQITIATKRSLRSFGIAALFLSFIGPTGIIESSFVPVWIAGVFLGLIISQLYLSVDDEQKVRRIGFALSTLVAIFIIESIARQLIVPYPLPPIMLIMTLPTLLVVSFLGALYVLRESPSPFTVSMFIIIVFTLIAAITATLGFISSSPQYFLLQILPIVVAAGVLSSMLRPWRNIVTLSFLTLILSTGPALIIPAFLANNMTIFLFTVSLTFALLCLTIPFSFFLRQAVETRATTALYISVSLLSIGLLALTHGNNFAIANSAIGLWDEGILFIDWFFGLLAVSTFTLSAIAASFSANVRHASREVILAFTMMLLTLGHPIVRWVEFDGEMIQRWELDPLYLGIIGLLAIAFIVFFKMSYQLWKVGSGRAGLRFIFFMFAALFLGIVAMFADNIPLDFLVPLLLLAGVMLILSSPQRNPFAKR